MPNKIVKATPYKVQDGDTLQSIADTNGLTVSDLAKFNFGTDVPDQINKSLRNKVGSFKRPDGHNFVLTSNDDPGIIYIPQTVPPKSFSTNSTNTITVKPIKKKEFVASKVMVQFRPLENWQGKFGFDWLRIRGDILVSEKPYKDIIDGGYDGTDAGMTKEDAFKKLVNEYENLPTLVKAQKSYFVPWLNLYPKTAKGSPTPPSVAELRMSVIVEDEEALSIEFDYNKNLFELSLDSLSDKAVTAQKKTSEKTLKITCLDEFDTEMEIKVLAYPKTWQADDPIPVAGKIKIPANSRPNRRSIKFVFVKVLTDVLDLDVPSIGSYGGAEVTNMHNSLYQALIHGDVENGPELDLTDNADYKTGGKFVDAASNKFKWSAPDFRSGLRTLYFAVKDGNGNLVNAKYDNSKTFTVFSFDEPAVNNVIGAIEGIGIRNLVLFADRDTTTVNHEVMHGLGLRHTHKESFAGYKVLQESKYTYPFALTAGNADLATDNVMSYSSVGLTTWHWQWKILKEKN